MRTRLLTGLGALAVALSLTDPARADRTGFGIDRFEPAERGSQFFVLDTLDLRGNMRPAAGVVFDYAHKPLVVYDRDGNEKGALVRHQLFTRPGASFVLFERFRGALDAPIALYQDGEPARIGAETYKPADKPAFGDVRLAIDARLFGSYGDKLTLAAGLRTWLPTGQRSLFTSDGSFRLAPQVMLGGDVGPLTYAARLALVYRARDDTYAGRRLGSEIVGGVGAGLKSLDGRLVIGPEVYTSTVFTNGDSFFGKRTTPAEWLFGMHADPIADVRIAAGVGGGLTQSYGSPELRTLLSITWVPSPTKPDRDYDSIPDDVDACPDESGPPDPDPRLNGCPPRTLAPTLPIVPPAPPPAAPPPDVEPPPVPTIPPATEPAPPTP